jgi:hypothetical protein
MPQKLSQEIISAAIAGFAAQKERINSNIAELRISSTIGTPALKLRNPSVRVRPHPVARWR